MADDQGRPVLPVSAELYEPPHGDTNDQLPPPRLTESRRAATFEENGTKKTRRLAPHVI